MGTIIVRKANPSDADAVWSVIQDGIATIGSLGISQWQHGYPNRAVVERDIERGVSYVAEDAETGEKLGTLAVTFDAEDDYASPTEHWLTPDPKPSEEPVYAVVHRNAVAHAAIGRGVMRALFAAAEKAARDAGRASVRVDTHPRNTNQRGMLEHLGYAFCGQHEYTPKAGEPDIIRVGYEKLL